MLQAGEQTSEPTQLASSAVPHFLPDRLAICEHADAQNLMNKVMFNGQFAGAVTNSSEQESQVIPAGLRLSQVPRS